MYNRLRQNIRLVSILGQGACRAPQILDAPSRLIRTDLPNGKRKEGLDTALNELLLELFALRILPFDQRAATIYASLVGQARAGGHHISVAEGQIAAIAKLHGFAVATRDIAPFATAGAPVINPWGA